ncbi:hypothetical protein ACSBR1_025993 [Camellia fascicularis]
MAYKCSGSPIVKRNWDGMQVQRLSRHFNIRTTCKCSSSPAIQTLRRYTSVAALPHRMTKACILTRHASRNTNHSTSIEGKDKKICITKSFLPMGATTIEESLKRAFQVSRFMIRLKLMPGVLLCCQPPFAPPKEVPDHVMFCGYVNVVSLEVSPRSASDSFLWKFLVKSKWSLFVSYRVQCHIFIMFWWFLLNIFRSCKFWVIH